MLLKILPWGFAPAQLYSKHSKTEMMGKKLAAGPNNLSAILLTNTNLCTCYQVTADNQVFTMRENYHRGNKVTDLLIYPAGLITQNTTFYIQNHSKKQL